MFEHLKQLFDQDFGDSFGVEKVIQPQHRMTLTEKWDHLVKLCQML